MEILWLRFLLFLKYDGKLGILVKVIVLFGGEIIIIFELIEIF